MYAQQPVFFIYGPTGVGKTDLVLMLAQTMPVEIINMDSGQLYTPFSIGTAKPAWQTEQSPHHLFDVIDTPTSWNAMHYRHEVLALVKQIHARGALPILVGGTGFYLSAVLFPLSASVPTQAATIPTKLPPDEAYLFLSSVDPERARAIHPHDHYRIYRALAIWHATGTKPSDARQEFDPPFPFTIIYLSREREELATRINQRVDEMLANGWVDEVQDALDDGWYDFLIQKKLIGYNEIAHYLRNETNTPFDEVRELIKRRTRQYAKRQETYWKALSQRLDKESLASPMVCCRCPMSMTVNLTITPFQRYSIELLELMENVRNCSHQ